MIKCPNCSAELYFSPSEKIIKCDYCGSSFSPEELNESVKYSEENIVLDEAKEKTEGKSYCCSSCGATLLTFDETAITFCSYCGSQAMIESKMMKINNPDYIIPFSKTKEECVNNYKKKIKKHFFAPTYMKNDIVVSKFRGIFMPYSIYNLSYHDTCINKGSVYSHRSGDYKIYNDYSISSKVDADYDGLSYDLSSRFFDKYSHSIPFDFNECKEFNPNYLLGFYADVKDVNDKVYNPFVEAIASSDCSYKLSKDRQFRHYGCYSPIVPIKVKDSKIGMFPVYFLAIRNEKKGTINYAVVNGQTGKVAFETPIDFKKYIGISFVLAIIVFLLINNYILILPKNVLIFSLIMSIISFFISNNQLNKIFVNRHHYDDLGVNDASNNSENDSNDKSEEQKKVEVKTEIKNEAGLNLFATFFKFIFAIFFIPFYLSISISFSIFLSKMFEGKNEIGSSFSVIWIVMTIITVVIALLIKKSLDNRGVHQNIKVNVIKKKPPFKEKFKKYLYKQLIAIIISIVIIILNPFEDSYYYGTAILSFLLTIISFYDLVNEHNELVSSKLPQLEKRGGDENA
ncbi:MAG: hypothetical protein IJ568_00755 [Bacilli bacterium]|nr:hypothetical protein [Bacilli bacterium]